MASAGRSCRLCNVFQSGVLFGWGIQELFRRLFGLGGPTSQQGQQQQRQQQRRQQQQQQQQQQQRRSQQQGQWEWEAQRRPASGDPRDPAGYYKALGVRPEATKDEIQVTSEVQLGSWVATDIATARADIYGNMMKTCSNGADAPPSPATSLYSAACAWSAYEFVQSCWQ